LSEATKPSNSKPSPLPLELIEWRPAGGNSESSV
jgi:hypothetical protein